MPTKTQVLNTLNLGNSVAEFDDALENYFVETETFRALVRDQGDIIAGDKGTGKTAMFRILQKRYRTIAELTEVEVITGFNPDGAPVFERLASAHVMDEGQYTTVWKAYILSLVGNWILPIYEGAMTENMVTLDEVLRAVGLRTGDDLPTTVFSKLTNLYRRLTDPDSIDVSVTITPEGMPFVSGRVDLGENDESTTEISHRTALDLLDKVVEESELQVWVILDRLDEAFQGYPNVEIPALRALLRTFLDLQEFSHLRLKLFLRKDLFRRIIGSGFVNLTHVNARKIEIVWDDDDLLDLLARRIKDNPEFLAEVGLDVDASVDDVMLTIFPSQVDTGERRPSTKKWILSRIRDSNDVKAPRNLIDLVQKAQKAQLRREQRDSSHYDKGDPLIQSEAIKRGLAALSEARVEDTLLAEASGELGRFIELFRGGKAEHNDSSLTKLLELDVDKLSEAIKSLIQIGFLETYWEFLQGANAISGRPWHHAREGVLGCCISQYLTSWLSLGRALFSILNAGAHGTGLARPTPCPGPRSASALSWAGNSVSICSTSAHHPSAVV